MQTEGVAVDTVAVHRYATAGVVGGDGTAVGEWHGSGRKGRCLLNGSEATALGVEVDGLKTWFVGRVWIWGQNQVVGLGWEVRL